MPRVGRDCSRTFEDSLILYGRDTRICLPASIVTDFRPAMRMAIPEHAASTPGWLFAAGPAGRHRVSANEETIPWRE